MNRDEPLPVWPAICGSEANRADYEALRAALRQYADKARAASEESLVLRSVDLEKPYVRDLIRLAGEEAHRMQAA